jgi:hypothetical protein
MATSDADPFDFDAADPWPFRGMEEPSNPNLAVEDERLFVETDPSRGDGSWASGRSTPGTPTPG